MEGLAWLLIKIALLLALAGAVFFALGWWLRDRQPQPAIVAPPSVDIEQIKAAARAAEAERDATVLELTTVRSQLAAAEQEVRRLLNTHTAQISADSSNNLVLQPPAEETPKPKVKRKPRAKKTKA